MRSSSASYVDVHFGDHRLAVEGRLQQAVAMPSRPREGTEAPPADGWMSAPSGTRPA